MKMSGLDKIVFLTPNSQVQAVYGWQGGSPAKGYWGLSSPLSPLRPSPLLHPNHESTFQDHISLGINPVPDQGSQ